MKVLAINGSPHHENGHTDLILKPFLRGLEKAGAEISVEYTAKLKIGHCRGCLHCWFNTPGKCFQEDDMAWLLPEMIRADILVLATPVYFDGMTGPLKNCLDRMAPFGRPVLELRGGHCYHPPRDAVDGAKMVLVANCGYWEMDNFDPLLAHARAMAKNMSREFSGALLRPHGPALRIVEAMGGSASPVYDAAEAAGMELGRDGEMSPHTLSQVTAELMPMDQYIDIINKYSTGG